MLTKNYKLKNVSYYSIIGTVVGALIGYLLNYIDKMDVPSPTLRGLFVGFFVGSTIGLCEEFLIFDKFRTKTYFFLLMFRTFTYSFIFAFYELLINSGSNFLSRDFSISESIDSAVYKENYLRDLIIIAVISSLVIAALQIKRLHKPGDLIKYVTGRYHLPEETDKIFLFIDLKSSTSIAEKLGNTKYSSFLIDYFHDMTNAVLMSKAEIYQYIGDEVVLTWSFPDGTKYSRCIHCFYDIWNTMEMKKKNYLEKFGVYPQFKAAIHAGRVSVTWIGDIKKEIVYHGDVLNTTARILSECNRYDQSFLTTEYMLEKLELPEYLRAELVGELQLKGKQKKMKIFGLKNMAEN